MTITARGFRLFYLCAVGERSEPQVQLHREAAYGFGKWQRACKSGESKQTALGFLGIDERL
jgi:hypothetical protein